MMSSFLSCVNFGWGLRRIIAAEVFPNTRVEF